MKNKKLKLYTMYIICWIMTLGLFSVIGFQVWWTYVKWEEFGLFVGIVYVIFQILLLVYAAANVMIAWGGYLYEKHIYEKDSKNLWHV